MAIAFGSFTKDTYDQIVRQIQNYTTPTGTVWFLDYLNGNDYNAGLTPISDGNGAGPVKTLLEAYSRMVSGRNDTLYIIGDGATTGSVRLSSTFTWAKSACRVIGISSGTSISGRARIAPTSGATAFTPFFTVSGNGNYFANLQWFQGFSTGTTSQLGMTITGGRNRFDNCHIAGMGDNESAQSAGSRTLKISSTGENEFNDCIFGVDTITRTQANATLEFASGTPRNIFNNCIFPFMGSAAGVLGILGTGAACMDRFQVFNNCIFTNAIKSTSTVMTVLASLTSASPGGLFLFKQCILLGITDYGDTNGLANSYIDGFTGAAATSGIAVNPS